MEKAAILFAGAALLATATNVLTGAAVGLGWMSVARHWRIAIPAVLATLFAWTFVTMYFLGAFAWVKDAVGERKLAAAVLDEARRIRSAALPWVCGASLSVMAAYVLGGGADTRRIPASVHLAAALVALLFQLVAAYRTVILVGMSLDLAGRIEGDRIA